MESQAKSPENRKIQIEELSREELIKKCRSLLALAHKAKQSKDEIAEELRKLKENDSNLQTEITQSLTAKLTEVAESKDKARILEAKNKEFQSHIKNLEEKCAKQILENGTLKETLKKLNERISDSEVKHSQVIEEYEAKCKRLEGEIQQIVNELKVKENCCLKVEDKYKTLENTLSEFQIKYLDEIQKQTQLQETLKKLQDRPNSRSSSESLKTVNENAEFETLQEKFNEKVTQVEQLEKEIELLKSNLEKSKSECEVLSKKFCEGIDVFNKSASEQLQSAQAFEVEINELKILLESKEKKIESLRANNEEYETKLNAQFENHLKSLSENEKALQEKLKETSEGIDDRTKEIEKLRGNLEHLENEQKTLSLMLEESLNKIQNYETIEIKELFGLRNKCSEDEAVLNKIKEDYEELKHLKDKETESLQQTLQEMEAALKQTKEELKVENNNYDKLLCELKETKDKIKCGDEQKLTELSLSNELENLRMSIDEKERIILNLENIKTKVINEYEEKVNQLQQNITELNEHQRISSQTLEETINTLKLEKNEKELVITTLEQELVQEKLQTQSLEQEVVSMRDEILKKEEELVKLNEQNKNNSSQLMEDATHLSERLSKLQSELDKVKTERDEQILALRETLANKEENINTLSSELNIVKQKFEDMERNLYELQAENKELSETLESKSNEHTEEMKVLRSETKSLQDKEVSLSELCRESEKLNSVLKSERDELFEKLNNLQRMNDENCKYEEEKLKLENNCTELKAELASIKLEYDSCSNRRSELEKSLSAVQSLFKDMKELKGFVEVTHADFKKNINLDQSLSVIQSFLEKPQAAYSELLDEMNQMNQEMKQRGETINQLQGEVATKAKEISEKENRIMVLEEKCNDLEEKLSVFEKEMKKCKLELENKDKALKDTEDEIWRLRNDSQAEVLSTSTISKVEEVGRMTDVEESFEERYTKLKALAVRLKKKVADLTNQLESERGKLSAYQSQVKTLQNIQNEYDNLQDQVEELNKEKTSMRKTVDQLKGDLESSNKTILDLTQENENFKKDKKSFETIKSELLSQIQSLKKELDKENQKIKFLEKDMEQLHEDLRAKDKKLDGAAEEHKRTLELLQAEKMETKKHSVLSLEMADYERIANDLNKKLEFKEKTQKELESHLETQRNISQSLQDRIIELETAVNTHEETIKDNQQRLKNRESELTGKNVLLDETNKMNQDIQQQLEDKKSEIEYLKIELSTLGAEKQKFEEKSRSNQEYLSRQIHMLEDSVSTMQESLDKRDMESKELKSEFESYKIRAQSVLRQSQKDSNLSKQQNTLEELEQMRSSSESLKSRLEETSAKLKSLLDENKLLLEDKTRLHTRVQEMTSLLTELRKENRDLIEKEQKLSTDHEESVRLNKLQTDTLVSCYQKQIEEKQVEWQKEKEFLEREVDSLKTKFLLHQTEPVTVHRRTASNGASRTDREVLETFLSEREEGEGSESVDSTSPNNPTNLIPLERLLNEPDHTESKSPPVDISVLKDKLDKSENRIKHLTTLLSDAESDSARLKQLNDLLKEEIRRNERSVEREKHAHNLEYLKNVVLKFISLTNVDERLRLVPVLNTILKLSPEEHNMLISVAKGDFNSKGWSSYLGLWAGSQ